MPEKKTVVKSKDDQHLIGVSSQSAAEQPKPKDKKMRVLTNVKKTLDAEDKAEQDSDPIAQKAMADAKVDSLSIATYHTQDAGVFPFITRMFETFFKLKNVGWASKLTDWNYPDALDGRGKHVVWRCYNYARTCVDIFDEGTPLTEIHRIKAHMEALHYGYTWFTGGELDTLKENEGEKFMKKVFGERLKPLKLKEKVKIPQTLEEAGFASNVSVSTR